MNMAVTLSAMAIAGIVAGGIAGICLLGLMVKIIITAVARKSSKQRLLDLQLSHLVESRSVESNEYFTVVRDTAGVASEIESAPPIITDNVSHTTDSYTDVRIEQEGSIHGEEDETQLTTFADINHDNQATAQGDHSGTADIGAALHTTDSAAADTLNQDIMKDENILTASTVGNRDRGNEVTATGGRVPDDRASRTTDSDTDVTLEREIATNEMNKGIALEQEMATDGNGSTRPASYNIGDHGNMETDEEDAVASNDDNESYTTDSDTDTKVGLEATLDKQRSKAVSIDSIYDDEVLDGNISNQQPESSENTTENPEVVGLENFSYLEQSQGDGDNDNFQLRVGFQSQPTYIPTTSL